MKKIMLFALVAAGIGFTSCSKCKTCTISGSPDYTLCQEDFDTKEQYNAAVSLAELSGYNCK